MYKVFKQDVHEFIRNVGTNKWIVLCKLRQYFLEVVVMRETQMPRANDMKYVQWKGIELCATF